MNENVFIKSKSDKFNPDIKIKFKDVQDTRNNNVFKKSEIYYNGITNIKQNTINNIKDLQLNNNSSKLDINKLIAEKEFERKQLDELLLHNNTKNNSNKIINNKNNVYIDNIDNIDSFNNLKNKSVYENSNNSIDILNDLQELGILEK